MKNKLTLKFIKCTALLLLLSTLSLQPSTVFAQDTAFTYQGRLNASTNPATGIYDLRFAIFDSLSAGSQQGSTLTNTATSVSNGLFVVALDFGNQFPGADRWLEIGVRTNGSGPFSTLSPRQQLTPAPYAIFAEGASAAGISGTIPTANLTGTYGSAVTFNNAANNFSGNGTGLTNVNAATLGGLGAANFWQLGGNNIAPGQFLGSTNNQALELKANGVRALRLEGGALSGKTVSEGYPYPNGAPNMIGGSPLNFVALNVVGATIGGGGATNYENHSYSNSIYVDFATIGGGLQNTIEASDYIYTVEGSTIGGGTINIIKTNAIGSTIGGGVRNTIQTNASLSTISGGFNNQVTGKGGFVGGGGYDGSVFAGNSAGGNVSTIGGGLGNTINTGANGAFIGGGRENLNSSAYSTIAGGLNNTNQSNTSYSTIGGGWLNLIQDGADQSVIAGGNAGHIQTGARESFIGGGFANTIQTNAGNSFIGGGAGNLIGTNSGYSAIAGGSGNSVPANAPFATIAGGGANISSGYAATIGGGYNNISSGTYSTVAGGVNNISSGFYGTVGGGVGNTNGGDFATVGGGVGNTNSGSYGTIGGGYVNTSSGNSATIGGGYLNTSSSSYATVGGGSSNVATNAYATVPGGAYNAAGGQFSFAAGFRAKALHNGAFVWADSTGPDFTSATNDQFLVRAANGVGINKTNPATALDVNGTVTATSFNGNGAGLASLNAANLAGSVPSASLTSVPAGNLTGTILDARLSANVALLNANQTFTGSNTIAPSVSLSFGSQVRQMLNLWGTQYGIGVQSSTVYFRTDNASGSANGFAWYKGGIHNDAAQNAGGGTTMMKLDGTGLTVNGTFVSASDRNAKQDFAEVNSRAVLEKVAQLPIQTWAYKNDPNTKHLGPVAQDFYATFGIGPDDKHIATVDEGGVALAAIQGLNQKLNEKDAEIQKLKEKADKVDSLEKRLNELEQMVQSLAANK
jgi:hypothetical protein